jgi:hypothetical protein
MVSFVTYGTTIKVVTSYGDRMICGCVWQSFSDKWTMGAYYSYSAPGAGSFTLIAPKNSSGLANTDRWLVWCQGDAYGKDTP